MSQNSREVFIFLLLLFLKKIIHSKVLNFFFFFLIRNTLNFIQEKSVMISEENKNQIWRNILHLHLQTSNMSNMFSQVICYNVTKSAYMRKRNIIIVNKGRFGRSKNMAICKQRTLTFMLEYHIIKCQLSYKTLDML